MSDRPAAENRGLEAQPDTACGAPVRSGGHSLTAFIAMAAERAGMWLTSGGVQISAARPWPLRRKPTPDAGSLPLLAASSAGEIGQERVPGWTDNEPLEAHWYSDW